MAASSDGCARITIVGFDGENHIEFVRRIIEPLDRRQQLIDHASLAPERRDDAVHRPFLVWRGGHMPGCGRIRRSDGVSNDPDPECCWKHHKKESTTRMWGGQAA